MASLLAVGEHVVTGRGYLGTRVEDVIDAAKVSGGALYRYFDNAQDLVRVVTARAKRALKTAFADLPPAGEQRCATGSAGSRR